MKQKLGIPYMGSKNKHFFKMKNKEIKFRAFHLPTKKMFKVYSWCKEWVFEDSEDGVGTSPYLPAGDEDCVLMQFTGLTDKNGVEIYDRDYLLDRCFDEDLCDISSKLLVVYDSDNAVWCVDNSFKKDFSSLVPLVEYLGRENLEVAGNFYENPELL